MGAPVAVDPGVQDGAMAFSADGRWAFVIGTGGQVVVIDARTGAQHPIGADLPIAYQLSVKG